MTDRESPKLDARRADDFRAELTERARAWMRDWNIGEANDGFGAALLDVAARFSAQVAERLDRAGEKLSLGLLDWLALRGKAARPARMPVAFRLADNATNPVLAPHPVRLQVDVDGASVVFETESDVRLVPGDLELLVGVDPDHDSYFLPPGGLSDLEPLEPLPTQWRTKAFAQSGAARIQLDPPLGLAADLLLEIGGRQYRVETVDGDLVKLEPAIDALGGIAANTEVNKVASFDPFGSAVRNQQRHYVYLGDDDLFNIDSSAVLEIRGADTHLFAASWEYFGKAEGDVTSAWRPLVLGPPNTQGAGKLTLFKPKGSVEPTPVGKMQPTRWIRAGQEKVESATDILSTEMLAVVVNPGAAGLGCPASGAEANPGMEPSAEGFANITPLALASAFYPLGQQPKQFDTFYLGSGDAFSKKGAEISICFEMSDPTANAFSAMREGLFANRLLASVGGDGALHLIAVDGTTGALSRFLNYEPLQPKSESGAAVTLASDATYRPPMWAVNDDDTVSSDTSSTSPFGMGLFGILGVEFTNPFYVAVTAGTSVWVRKEYPSSKAFSKWLPFGNVPAPPSATGIDGLVYLRDGDNAAGALLFAACGGKLFSHSALAVGAREPWATVPLTNAPAGLPSSNPYRLKALAPIDRMPAMGRWHGSIADGMVGVFSNSTESLVYFVEADGTCTALDNTLPAAQDTLPAAAHIATKFYVFWQLVSPAPILPATRLSVFLHVAKVDDSNRANHIGEDDSVPVADGPEAVAGGLLEIPPSDVEASVLATGTRGNDSWILSWKPFGGASPKYFETKLLNGVGPLGGAPTSLDRFVVVPGTQSDAWSARWDASLRHDFHVTLESGVVVPTVVTPPVIRHDYVAIETTGDPLEKSEVTALDYTLGSDRFYSLQDEFGIGSANSQLVLYRHASATGFVGVFVDVNKMSRDPTDRDSQRHDWLLVTGTGYFRFRRVLQINGGSEIQFYAIAAGFPNVPLTYWRPERFQGRAAPFMRLDPNLPEGAWDARLLEQVRLNFTDRDPATQTARAFAVTPAGRPTVVVMDAAWNAASPHGNGGAECSFDAALGPWARQLSENTTDPKLIWEFWNGRGWDELTIDKDDTQNFKVTGKLEFKVPATLAPTDVSGKTNHWIRARLIQGDYGREVITVLTQPHPTIAGATVQEVLRDSVDFHPPLVVNMRFRYSVNATPPAYVLTQDGGSLRDQSDANRTSGTFVEAFVPLAVQLGRLEHADTEGQSAPCASLCDCNGKPGVPAPIAGNSIPAASTSPAAATSFPQCILLGFSAGLVGAPINVLLLVEERGHEDFAPLAVKALVNDRFESITVRDTTRALGESGLLSMSFSVKPSPRDLFGRSLTWLLLRPSRTSAGAAWRPVIRGAYLNATWATAAETLTREPLGSSDGRPHLTVQVARPPLLQDSLELRVREPLDDEERRQLVDEDAANVKSGEPDLKGDWVLWKQVPDPDDAGPRERVYSLDEQSGEIEFGDGIHGMIPPIGRDAVVAFSYRRIEPAADGSQSVPANAVTARAALQLVTPVESVEAAFAADGAAGGSPPESDGRVLRFGNARLKHRGRAIAASDFEDLALQSSPDVAQARAFHSGQGIRLVVVMRGPQPGPNAAQRRELQRLLQSAASPLLGHHDAVTISGPKVRLLRLRLALRVASLDDAGRLGEQVKLSLTRLFDSATGGVSGSGWPLGAPPSDDDIALALYSTGDLAGIDTIELVEIDARGNELPWRAQLRADELVVLADDALRTRFEPLELAV